MYEDDLCRQLYSLRYTDKLRGKCASIPLRMRILLRRPSNNLWVGTRFIGSVSLSISFLPFSFSLPWLLGILYLLYFLIEKYLKNNLVCGFTTWIGLGSSPSP